MWPLNPIQVAVGLQKTLCNALKSSLKGSSGAYAARPHDSYIGYKPVLLESLAASLFPSTPSMALVGVQSHSNRARELTWVGYPLKIWSRITSRTA